jgi:hypothetical protein
MFPCGNESATRRTWPKNTAAAGRSAAANQVSVRSILDFSCTPLHIREQLTICVLNPDLCRTFWSVAIT